jgi:predicted metal-dependent enzyme (double-stranded beta helix superfamily)
VAADFLTGVRSEALADLHPISPEAPSMPHQPLARLVLRLTEAIGEAPCDTTRCQAVEQALVDAATPELLPAALRLPHPDHYARHLVHRDSQGRFSMIAMVWGPGQGTPIHDHGGLWCVECVLQGSIEVHAYQPYDRESDDRQGFRRADMIKASFGEAGHLIPPLDHHVLTNPFDEIAVTLHVYGGDMAWCRTFMPHKDGGFVEERRELSVD